MTPHFLSASVMSPTSPDLIDVKNFKIDKKCIATGAWGTVHRAENISTKEIVAMKFFGYTQQHPVNHLISEEVQCMLQLRGVKGVAQLRGVFRDTKEGLVPNKNKKFCKEGYPVIVMDFLEGGDLFGMVINRIKKEQPVNEQFLAPAFRSAMESLLSIHERHFLHRDLKLDNMVLTSTADNAVVKIIDCGYFCRAPDGVVRETGLVGSPGYFAPESLQTSTGFREYSTKTDVWQAGCALYIMLSAKLPFTQDFKDFGKIIAGEYFSLDSYVWNDISPSAKALVAAMLHRNPSKRLSVRQVLSHPWLASTADHSCTPLGNGYMLRMGGFDLRQKLKKGFQAGKIEENHKEMKENFQEELPHFIDPSFVDRDKNDLDMEASALLTSEEFQDNLKALKRKIMAKINSAEEKLSAASSSDCDEDLTEVNFCAPPLLERQKSSIYGDDIGFSEFTTLVTGCHLECLATEKIFSIFDVKGDGYVNMKEFLFALIALKPFDASEGGVAEASELYFHFFDMNEDGYIELDELKFAFNCLFQDCHFGDTVVEDADSHAKKIDAEAVFKQMDKDNLGRIDIDKFKQFYDYVLMATISQKSKIALSTAAMGGAGAAGSGGGGGGSGSFFSACLSRPLSGCLSLERGHSRSEKLQGRENRCGQAATVARTDEDEGVLGGRSCKKRQISDVDSVDRI